VRFTQSAAEIADCGIAASDREIKRGEKIRYDLEIAREFPIFSILAHSQEWNPVLNPRARQETSDFCCRMANLAKLASPRK
jgi:hypothetical protein